MNNTINKTDFWSGLIAFTATMLPADKISPSAHNAIYDVERFLVLQVENKNKVIEQKTKSQLQSAINSFLN